MGVNTCFLIYKYSSQMASGKNSWSFKKWFFGGFFVLFLWENECGFSRTKPSLSLKLLCDAKDKHPQKCRWAVCSPQVLWDLQQMLAAQGLLLKLEVGTGTHRVTYGQCVGSKAFCSAAPAVLTCSRMVAGNSFVTDVFVTLKHMGIFDSSCHFRLMIFWWYVIAA